MAGGETQSSGGITTAGGGFFRARIAPPARQRKIPLRCISGHAPQLSRMLVGKPGEMLPRSFSDHHSPNAGREADLPARGFANAPMSRSPECQSHAHAMMGYGLE